MFNLEERKGLIYSSFNLVARDERPDPEVHTSYWCKVKRKSRNGVEYTVAMPRLKAIIRNEKIVWWKIKRVINENRNNWRIWLSSYKR